MRIQTSQGRIEIVWSYRPPTPATKKKVPGGFMVTEAKPGKAECVVWRDAELADFAVGFARLLPGERWNKVKARKLTLVRALQKAGWCREFRKEIWHQLLCRGMVVDEDGQRRHVARLKEAVRFLKGAIHNQNVANGVQAARLQDYQTQLAEVSDQLFRIRNLAGVAIDYSNRAHRSAEPEPMALEPLPRRLGVG